MNLNEIEAEIDPLIVERGYDYFCQDKVSLEKQNGAVYIFTVFGSANYTTSIRCKDEVVSHWECNCPYDMGPVCKHVVAGLFALREDKSLSSEPVGPNAKRKRATKADKLKGILSQLSLAELQAFITETAELNVEFRNVFIAHFSARLRHGKKDYKTLIRQILNSGTVQGFIDYQNSYKVIRPIYEMLSQTDALFSERRLEEFFHLNAAVIETVSEAIGYMDDSSGEAGIVINQAFSNLCELAQEPEYRSKIFQYAMEQATKECYTDFGFEEEFYAMILVGADSSNCREALQFFDKLLNNISDRARSKYRYERLLEYKYSLLVRCGQKDKADQLITDFIHVPSFREQRLEEYIAEKRYAQAVKLCDEGIDLALKEEYAGVVRNWQTKKMKVAELCGDTKTVHDLAWLLFFDGEYSMEHYEKLKSLYSVDAWPVVRKKIATQLEKDHWSRSVLMEIYSKENLLNELFALVSENPHLTVLKEYAHQLMDVFPEDFLSLWETAILDFVNRNVGRKYYRRLVGYLEYLARLKNGFQLAQKLSKEIRGLYPHRPAMLEELKTGGF